MELGKITAGEVAAGASDGAGATHTAEIEFVVTEAGDGVLTFAGGAKKAPQLDKIEITAADIEEALLFLSKINSLKLEGGFFILYKEVLL